VKFSLPQPLKFCHYFSDALRRLHWITPDFNERGFQLSGIGDPQNLQQVNRAAIMGILDNFVWMASVPW
jgi:hypothetical protein